MSGCLIALSNVENEETGDIFSNDHFYCIQISFSSEVTVHAVKKRLFTCFENMVDYNH